jgi:hypothetical protein
MANTVIALRSSGVTGNTPSLGVLANGELSLNFADGILYYKSSSNTLGSIRTTAVSGLTTEVQFNDAGSFGANANFTFNKTLATLNVKNINVSTNLTTVNLTATSITTGTGVGGIIAGANVIYSNVFVANTGGITTTGNSSLNGIVTVSYVAGAGNQNAAMEMIGANTKGGTGYFDFISANNNSAGTTNKNKYFRLNSNGEYQIINSAYTSNLFNLDDLGNVTIPGYLRTAAGYIEFSDGSKQYTANAGSGGGGGVTQIVAGTNVTISPAGGTGVVTINSSGGGTTDFGFGQIFTPNNSVYANATSANDKVSFTGESGVYVFANSTTKTITVAGTPGAQGMTVDYGYVSEAVFYSVDYGTL